MATSNRRSPQKPNRATLWIYKVGFGDCLLLELGYTKETRFVLIDFGSKGAPAVQPPAEGKIRPMVRIAEDIARRVTEAENGRLVAVTITHRHSDHLSGFAPNKKGNGPGDIIWALKPEVVVQPWTDEPSARDNWRGPGPNTKRRRGVSVDALGLTPGTLKRVEQFGGQAVEQAKAPGNGFAARTISAILGTVKDDVSNRPALDLIRRLCPKSKHDYVCAGMKPKNLARVLPGVDIQVLGPPSLRQNDAIFRSFKKKAEGEYWIARQGLSDQRSLWQRLVGLSDCAVRANGPRASTLFPSERPLEVPPEARWLVKRMKRDRGESLLEFVRSADHVLNNTSVVLLLTIGGKRLLFAGDAQLESWQHALEHASNAAAMRREVAKTDLYKVSHHGSRNATPRSLLWEAFAKRGGPRKPHRLTTVLSTATGPFQGKPGSEGEVPRRTLIQTLKAESNYISTHETTREDELCIRLEIGLR